MFNCFMYVIAEYICLLVKINVSLVKRVCHLVYVIVTRFVITWISI